MFTEFQILLDEIFGENKPEIVFPSALNAAEGLKDAMSDVSFKAEFMPSWRIPYNEMWKKVAHECCRVLGSVLASFVDMIKFAFDVLLICAALESINSMKLMELEMDYMLKLEHLVFALEWNGFGYLFTWFLNIMWFILDAINVSLNAGTRSACEPALIFYTTSVVFATILVTFAVVGGDLLGLLVAAKQKVLVYQREAKDNGQILNPVSYLVPGMFKGIQAGVF